MVVAYVALQPSLTATSAKSRVYALLLPDPVTGEWDELVVRPSKIDKGGFGVFPRERKGAVRWSKLEQPVLLPYLGHETVVKDAHTQRMLLSVLRGEFQCLTVHELCSTSETEYVVDGLFAVPRRSTAATWARAPLDPSTELLQVRFAASRGDLEPGRSSACYLLSDDVRSALNLSGERAHLFDVLCAHARHEHVDRHLATHVAEVHRKEEGFVLINAHPGFADAVGLTGIVNEPCGGHDSIPHGHWAVLPAALHGPWTALPAILLPYLLRPSPPAPPSSLPPADPADARDRAATPQARWRGG